MTLLAGSGSDKSKRIGDGIINLSKSYNNYDALLVVASSDNADSVSSSIIPIWELKQRQTIAKAMGINKFELAKTHGGGAYWFIDTINSTDKVLYETDSGSAYENSSILAVYGLKW